MREIKVDIKFIDASEWQEQFWLSSGGTRAKKILQDPNGNDYFFKCSEKKEAKEGKLAKEYKYEFWNEIIAYQLGKALGLNMLRYDIAIFGDEIGCLSPKMNNSEEELVEVGRFMTAINADFLPENNNTRKEYTFQLLEQTINEFKLSEYWEFFFQTILFDAIIGNTDRHQENWAFLGKTSALVKHIDLLDTEIKKIKKVHKLQLKDLPLPWYVKKTMGLFIDFEKEDLKQSVKNTQLFFTNIKSFAPIYDSGSSLLRELQSERVEELLQNELALESYINKGFAELHWDRIKLNHFKLIENIVNSSYLGTITKSAVFPSNWNDSLISIMLADLDKDLPVEWNKYRIPDNRKKLIIKIVSLRFQKLKDLFSGRI